ncbi:MAG TPA: FAD-dependent monooxygenase [Baekduia sp.]|nr:FAD-dependent monooxygenase [Baekduia sp.]
MRAIVVGAGIGGLAAAVALRRAGLSVCVLEQASQVSEIGAGLGLGPNAVGALTNLGLAPRLEASVVRPRWTTRRRWQDGAELFKAPLADTKRLFGYPFWFVHRADLQLALLQAARDSDGPGEPVDVRLKTAVQGVDIERGRVLTADGAELDADLVVGADGLGSVLRRALDASGEPIYTGHSGFRTQVPIERTQADPALRELGERQSFESWLGPGAHVVHCPFRSGAIINVTACIETDALDGPATSGSVSIDETLAKLEGWHDSLRALLASGDGVHRYDIYVREPLERWRAGRLVLIGDAAHPMLPYLGQGAAQAIEDAEALGAALEVLGVDEGLRELEHLRIARANRVQALSAANARTFHLPDGPEQQARDATIARGAIDSEVSRWLWEYQRPREAVAGVPGAEHRAVKTT